MIPGIISIIMFIIGLFLAFKGFIDDRDDYIFISIIILAASITGIIAFIWANQEVLINWFRI